MRILLVSAAEIAQQQEAEESPRQVLQGMFKKRAASPGRSRR
jgi:hypothetical protein